MTPKRGKTAECLEDFTKSAGIGNTGRGTGKDIYRIRNRICRLLGVASETGFAWFTKLILPSGENLLRLRFFLRFFGYQVEELEAIRKEVAGAAELVAFRVITIEEFAEVVQKPPRQALRPLMGQEGLSEQKLEKISKFCELYKSKLAEKKVEWKENLASVGIASQLMSTGSTAAEEMQNVGISPATEKVPVPRLASSREFTIKVLAGMIKSAIPLAELMASDDFSPEERQALRQLTSNGRSNGVFDLSNLLNRLCSETAFKQFSRK